MNYICLNIKQFSIMTVSETTKNTIGVVIKGKFGKEKPILTNSIYTEVLLIPKKTFGKYIDNKTQPRLDELTRIADWLNVNPKDLF